MNFYSRPSYNYRERSTEKILPRLFTPQKTRRASDWLKSGHDDEKLAILKSLSIKEEERLSTDKVLKESFHPSVAPRVRMWLDEAKEEERRAIMKLFRTIASRPSKNHIAKPSMVPRNENPRSLNLSEHFPKIVSEVAKGEATDKKVQWDVTPRIVSRPSGSHGNCYALAQMRTEFDIAPDWRAPKRTVVPMTQVSRRVVAEGLPRLSKHTCLYNQREFVIHPEWIIH